MGNGRYNVTSFVEHIPMTSEIIVQGDCSVM